MTKGFRLKVSFLVADTAAKVSIFSLVVPTAQSLSESMPYVSERVRHALELGGVGLASGSFVGIVATKAWKRFVRRVAALEYDEPLFVPDIASIASHDDSFREDDFIRDARAIFTKVQDARQTSRTEALLDVMAPELWDAFQLTLEATAARHRHFVVERLKLHSAVIQSAINIQQWDSITVRMTASCAEFEVDQMGRVFGDRRMRAWREDWTFQRSTNRSTHLRASWMLTAVEPVQSARFEAQRSPSISEWPATRTPNSPGHTTPTL